MQDELDRAWRELDRVYRAIPDEFILVLPDGGDVKSYEGVAKMAEEIERLREALNADSQTLRLHLGEMTQQEMRTVKAAFSWVLARSALQQKDSK